MVLEGLDGVVLLQTHVIEQEQCTRRPESSVGDGNMEMRQRFFPDWLDFRRAVRWWRAEGGTMGNSIGSFSLRAL